MTMPEYKAPLRDMRFLIDHVFDFHSNYAALGATDASADMVSAILEEGAKFCENVLRRSTAAATKKAAISTMA
jgi:hypothetical protein